FRRDEYTHRAVSRLQIRCCNSLDVRGSNFLQPIAMQKKKTPITLCHPLAEFQTYLFRRVEHEINVLQQTSTFAIDFFLGRWLGRDFLDCLNKRASCRVK